MNRESLTEKLLDLVEGRETPETWWSWWDEHETELEALLSRGEFLKLKPCRHGFQWVPVFGSQKGAIAILEKTVGPGVWQPKGSHRHSGKERHSI